MDGADRVTSSDHFSRGPEAALPASVAGSSLETMGASALRVLGWLGWPGKIGEGAGNSQWRGLNCGRCTGGWHPTARRRC
jgi:hypothetical protein